jgi:hypothetical protein
MTTKRWFVLSLAGALLAYGQKIETQKTDRRQITRVETALNHLTVIEMADPVDQVAIGSTSFKVEWRENKVFVQPLEPDSATNLFIWTRAGSRLSFELVPAGRVEKMHFAIDQEPAVAAAVAPPPVTATVEPQAIPSEMLRKSLPVRFTGDPGGKQKVAVVVRDLYERDGKVYLRYEIRNGGHAGYQPGTPVVSSLKGARGPQSLQGMRRTQLADKLASRLTAKGKDELRVVHSELYADVVAPGKETIGFVAFERPASSGPTVLRLTFPADRNQEVVATLVL